MLGAVPLVGPAMRAVRGAPQAARMRPAETMPPWAETKYLNLAQEAAPLDRGWVNPSTREVLEAADRGYAATRTSPLTYHPGVGEHFAGQARTTVLDPSFAREGVPGVHSLLDRFSTNWAERGRPVTGKDWDEMRQQLRNFEGKEGVAGRKVSDLLDQYMTSPPRGAFVSGTQRDLDDLTAAFDYARGNYRAGKTAETVENAIDRAYTRSGVTHSAGNLENVTRQRMEALAGAGVPSDKLLGATRPERATVLAASQPGRLEDWMRWGGKYMGGGGGLGQGAATTGGFAGGAALAHLMGADPMSAMAFGAAGATAVGKGGGMLQRAGAERAVRGAEEAAAAIRRNSPLYRERAAGAPEIADPRGMMRDAMAYALTPQVTGAARDWWDEQFIPHANR